MTVFLVYLSYATVLGIYEALAQEIPMSLQRGTCTLLVSEQTEAQRSEVTHPRSHSFSVAEIRIRSLPF